jgi:protoporphyrinogen oxidase
MRTNFSSRAKIGYLKGGFSKLIDRLCFEITKNKGVIKTGTEITLDSKNNFEINGEKFDFVINTSSSLAGEKIDYLGVINLVLEMDNKQTGYYWNNILDKDIPFVGIIEHTNFIDKSYYRGSHLLYLTQYIVHDSEWMTKSENEIINDYEKHFEKLGISQSDIIQINLFRDKYAQPVIPTNYTRPDYKTKIDNFYNLTQASIYPEDRGLNQIIREARALVDKHFA